MKLSLLLGLLLATDGGSLICPADGPCEFPLRRGTDQPQFIIDGKMFQCSGGLCGWFWPPAPARAPSVRRDERWDLGPGALDYAYFEEVGGPMYLGGRVARLSYDAGWLIDVLDPRQVRVTYPDGGR